MTCDELRDDYELYALGVLDEPERSELGEHLRSGCPRCSPGVDRARRLVAQLAADTPDAKPPGRLRKRVLNSIGAQPPGFPWAPLLAFSTALALFGVVYFFGRQRDTTMELVRARDAVRGQAIELSRLNDALAVLQGADTRQVIFGAETQGRVFVNPRRGVLLIASNLPPAPAGKAYEMWVIPKGGNPVPAGLFQSDSSGTALHVSRAPVDPNTTAAVAVTLEDAAGAPQPTSQPLILAKLG